MHLPVPGPHLLTLERLIEPGCLRYTQIPHTTRLFEDFSYHFERVARFYGHRPDQGGIRDAVAELRYPDDRRAALVEALRHQNDDSPSLRELAKPGTVAVVSGQQVGLFSGPAYTVYKALTAVRIAQRLRDEGIRAVPVFWLATEDHDFAEVNHSWVFDFNHQPAVLRAQANPVSQQPVGSIRLRDIPLQELHELLRPFPFADEVLAKVAQAYTPERTMGAAFRDLLKNLLGKYDLLYLDPLDEHIRRLGAPLLREAVRSAADLKAELLQRDADLRAAGYHAQVHLEQQTSLVFLLDGDRRITLRRQNGDYITKDARYSPEELMERAEHLSPNALLRPVMQDYLLPTVVYVGGPAELAYFAQAQAIYKALLGHMPVVVHRAGFTLLDARAEKLLDRYTLDWAEIFEGEDRIREQIARRLVPPGLQQTAAGVLSEVQSALLRYTAGLNAFDPTLAAAMANSRKKILFQLSKIERKTAREAMRRDERAARDASFLAGLLYPNKHLQERLYTILPFLAKHGPGLIDTIHDRIELDCPDHQVLVV
jgi:bacillithiol biosynthesis cysteine-adding enzyme BshC